MKVLFINELKDATITALAPNENYPASNLIHVFAKVKYKGVGYSDTITATLPDNVSASCFFYTYTNATSMTVRVYSGSSVLLETLTVDCTYDSGAEYFDLHTDVRWIEIDIASAVSEDVYLGGIALGVATTMPYPSSKFEIQLQDNSGKSESADGQVSHHYIKPLREYELNFSGVPKLTYHAIVELFEAVGSGHIWADITELSHATYKPLYCTTGLVESPTKNGSSASFKLRLLEAR